MKTVSLLRDDYFDIPLHELHGVINGIREVEEKEHLNIKKATMYIDAEWHALNCVGEYDVTDIVRKHKSLALYQCAVKHTIKHPWVAVGIIIEWEEN